MFSLTEQSEGRARAIAFLIDAYEGVSSQIAQVTALRQAVASNRASLQAVEAGYEVGTRIVQACGTLFSMKNAR